MANAHEGTRRVDAHGVLPTVVLPLGTLVDIWKRSEGDGEENRSQGSRRIQRYKQFSVIFRDISQWIHQWGHINKFKKQMQVSPLYKDDFMCCCTHGMYIHYEFQIANLTAD